ncbi:MAG: hypothetical protein EPN45_21085 [Rhizobiaceae bacterium]|nr:MAG: hypothetical protein EPN45_21085 [Rhizobiaceae bacterium]
MSIRVVTPPSAVIVKPSDLAGGYQDTDVQAQAVIAAVTETIDGPTGWLGRAIGPQTLELTLDGWHAHRHHHHWHEHPHAFRLPCPPIIAVESVIYLDTDGNEQTVDATDYAVTDNLLWFTPVWTAPTLGCFPEPIRVQYKAGYNGTDGAAEGEAQTGAIPARVKQAIMLTSQHMLNVGTENLFLREVQVPDVETRQFTVTDQASALIEQTCERLLGGLRVYA